MNNASARTPLRNAVTAVLASGAALLMWVGLASPASAAGETLDVAISAQTGTPEWDDSDGGGYDSGPDNNIIRTNDTPLYRVDVVSNGGTAENTIVELTLPQGQEFRSVPSFCRNPDDTSQVATPSPATMPAPEVPLTPASWQTLPVQTLTCHIGNVQNGSTQYLTFPAWQRSEVPDGTQLDSASATVRSDFVTTPVESDEDVSMVVSAGPRWDVSKNGTAQQENRGYVNGATVRCSWDSEQVCFRYTYPLMVGGQNGGKGNTPLTGPVTVTDLLNPTSFYGESVTSSEAWQDAGAGANDRYAPRLLSCSTPTTIYQQPGNGSNTVNSVRESGDVTCAQSAPGEDATITITNTDWSLYTAASRYSTPDQPMPGDEAWAVSATVTIEVPRNAVVELGTESNGTYSLPSRNEYDDFAATALDGTQQPDEVDETWNNYRTVTPTVTRPGGFGKAFAGVPGDAGNTPRGEFGPSDGYSEGPPGSNTRRDGETPIAAGQDVISLLVLSGTNQANQAPGSGLLCDAWDNSRLQLHARDYPAGTASGQTIGSTGSAVWNSGNQYTSTRPDYTVQYSGSTTSGPGQGSTCRDGEWYDNPADVPGNDPQLAAQGIYTAVSQVRVWTTIEEPTSTAAGSVRHFFSIGLRAVPGQEAGDILPNWASATLNFGEELSQEELLERASSGSSYNPENHSGNPGDRLIFTPAYVRIDKQVSINGGDYGELENATGGDTATWRLQPTISSSSPAENQLAQPVTIEDCLPDGFVYQSASITPAVVQQAPAPEGAEITCDSGTYVRFDLGDRVPNEDLPEILIETRVSSVASSGTYTNVASIQTDPGDPASFSTRSDDAQVNISQIAGLKLEKSPLTPVVQVNPEGNDELEQNVWRIDLANLDSPEEIRDVDIIDVLPSADGVNGSSFAGTMSFVSVEVTRGDGVNVLYTSAENVDSNPDADSNVATGIPWCDAPSGATLVSGVGACPTSASEVTGIRFQKPGNFAAGDRITADVTMVAEGNNAGDSYTNIVEASSPSLTFNVGPLDATEVAVSSSIGDRVWSDSNGNGVQDDGEPGIEGFRVVLSGTDDLGNPVELETTTDADGNYLFEGLRAGEYVVTFDPDSLGEGESFTTQSVGDDVAVDSDGDETTGETETISLGSDSQRTDIDQGVVIERGSIGDRVWIDADRDGIQDDGEEPVEGFRVVLTGTDVYGNEVSLETTTDADGNYLFENLVPGDYVVTFDPASIEESQSFTTQGAGDDSEADSDGDPSTGETATISLAPGENRRDIDQGLLLSASIGDRVWRDADGDGVQDDGEQGVEGVEVILYDANGDEVARTVTDENGNYLFDNLPLGDYSLEFVAPDGFAFTSKGAGDDDAADSNVDPTNGRTGTISLTRETPNVDTVDAGLVRLGSIGDRVWIDADRDGVQDEGDYGASGVTVVLYDGDGNEVARTETDGEGNYLFPNLPLGDYSVGFENLPTRATFTSQGAGDDATTDSDVDPSTGRTGVISLTDAEPDRMDVDAGLLSPLGSIGSRVWEDLDHDGVQDPGERPVPGVTVILYDSNGNEVRRTTTDENGAYLFTDLPMGDYEVEFTDIPDGYRFTLTGPDSVVDPETGRVRVTLTPDEPDQLLINAGVERVPAPSTPPPPTPPGEPSEPGLPPTGGTWALWLLLMGLIAAGAGVGIVTLRRRERADQA